MFWSWLIDNNPIAVFIIHVTEVVFCEDVYVT